MRILAIETSCDETAIAIIETDDSRGQARTSTRTIADGQRKSASSRRQSATFKVLANLVSSQIKIHEKFGGVVPNLARREHEKNLVPVLIKALEESGIIKTSLKSKIPDSKFQILNSILEREPILKEKFIKFVLPIAKPKIDAIAVTYGPGLAPALWAGVNFANALSALWNLPLIPVNHMEGHIFSSLVETGKNVGPKTSRYSLVAIRYPAIALLVSGGHTEIHLIKKLGGYKRLGETIDDAAGEAYDKVARMMELPYPGGPQISKLSELGNPHAINFPKPLLKTLDFNFSFSGLKTAVLYYLRDHKKYSKEDVAASFGEAVVEVLVEKTLRAAKKHKAKTILIGGGVAANKQLRRDLDKKIRDMPGIKLLLPQVSHTGDNALMIALAAIYGNPKKRNVFGHGKKISPESVLRIGAVSSLKL